jgi:hypothetical protein
VAAAVLIVVMAIRQCGFQEAVAILEPYAGSGAQTMTAQAMEVAPAFKLAHEMSTENSVFK